MPTKMSSGIKQATNAQNSHSDATCVPSVLRQALTSIMTRPTNPTKVDTTMYSRNAMNLLLSFSKLSLSFVGDQMYPISTEVEMVAKGSYSCLVGSTPWVETFIFFPEIDITHK